MEKKISNKFGLLFPPHGSQRGKTHSRDVSHLVCVAPNSWVEWCKDLGNNIGLASVFFICHVVSQNAYSSYDRQKISPLWVIFGIEQCYRHSRQKFSPKYMEAAEPTDAHFKRLQNIVCTLLCMVKIRTGSHLRWFETEGTRLSIYGDGQHKSVAQTRHFTMVIYGGKLSHASTKLSRIGSLFTLSSKLLQTFLFLCNGLDSKGLFPLCWTSCSVGTPPPPWRGGTHTQSLYVYKLTDIWHKMIFPLRSYICYIDLLSPL